MKCRLLSPATDEIAEAALWFESQASGLGSRFLLAVDSTIDSITQAPLRFARSEFSSDDIVLRYAYVDRFKYVVHFTIENDEVVVVAVTHAARKPGY